MLRTKVRHKYSFEDDRKLCKYYYDAVKAHRASALQPKGFKLWKEAARDGLFPHLTVDAMQTRFVNSWIFNFTIAFFRFTRVLYPPIVQQTSEYLSDKELEYIVSKLTSKEIQLYQAKTTSAHATRVQRAVRKRPLTAIPNSDGESEVDIDISNHENPEMFVFLWTFSVSSHELQLRYSTNFSHFVQIDICARRSLCCPQNLHKRQSASIQSGYHTAAKQSHRCQAAQVAIVQKAIQSAWKPRFSSDTSAGNTVSLESGLCGCMGITELSSDLVASPSPLAARTPRRGRSSQSHSQPQPISRPSSKQNTKFNYHYFDLVGSIAPPTVRHL
jgi:hypothetical protein